ncbi:MAG: hypothetical protein ACQXXF_08020 [Thermoplasmatota archaeon]
MFNEQKLDKNLKKEFDKKIEKINNILILIVLGLSIINFLFLTKIFIFKTQEIKFQNDKIENLYKESLIINDLANKNYLKNLEHNSNNLMFYDLFVVLQENNETLAYKVGKIAKDYSYIGNVINEVIDSKNIVFMLCPTFNVLSVYERRNFNFNPSYTRYSCSENSEWTMFMNEKGDLYDVLFGIYRGNYFGKEENITIEKLSPVHYKIMDRRGVLTIENARIYE